MDQQCQSICNLIVFSLHRHTKLIKNMDLPVPSIDSTKLIKNMDLPVVQLLSGHSRLRSFLFRTSCASSPICLCGKSEETIEHFLFQCNHFDGLRSSLKKNTRFESATCGSLAYPTSHATKICFLHLMPSL